MPDGIDDTLDQTNAGDPATDGAEVDPYVADDPELQASNNLAPDGTTITGGDDTPADHPAGDDDVIASLDQELGAAPAAAPPAAPAATGQTPNPNPGTGTPAAAAPAAPAPEADPFITKIAAARKGMAEAFNLTDEEAARSIAPVFDTLTELHTTAKELRDKVSTQDRHIQEQQIRVSWMASYTKVTPYLDKPDRFGAVDPFAENLGLTEQNVKDFQAFDKEVVRVLDQWKAQNKPVSQNPKDRYSFANAIKVAERRIAGAGGPVDQRRNEAAAKVQRGMTLPPGRSKPAPIQTRKHDPYAGHQQADAVREAERFMESRRQ